MEEKSLAAKNGLQAGDQVLDVNGTSFLDMSHADAIITLKQNPLLMMTVKVSYAGGDSHACLYERLGHCF